MLLTRYLPGICSGRIEMESKNSRKILAVASKGGHWEQLMLLRPAMKDCEVIFACTDAQQGENFNQGTFYCLSDYSRSTPLQTLKGFFEMLVLVGRIRPDIVISTGAAPGLLALVAGRVLGAKTIWVDSIANSQQMSMSGSLARRFCHVTVTQWQHLVQSNPGCVYWGSVI